MLLTQETDYALRILRSLSTESVISVQRLAEQEDLPRHFAHKIGKKPESSASSGELRADAALTAILARPAFTTLWPPSKAGPYSATVWRPAMYANGERATAGSAAPTIISA